MAVAAERLAGMSSSVPCRCRMQLLSWPGDTRDRQLEALGSCPAPCGQGDPQSQHGLLWERRTRGHEGEASKLPVRVGGSRNEQAQGDLAKNRVHAPVLRLSPLFSSRSVQIPLGFSSQKCVDMKVQSL